MLGEVAFPAYNTGDEFSVIQKKCADYAAARAIEDVARNGHVTSPTGLQSYVDECARHIQSERSTRQAMVLLGLCGAAAGVWWLCKHY